MSATIATAEREARLRRSLKRLGYESADASKRRYCYRRDGQPVHGASELSFDGVEEWIKQLVKPEGGRQP